MTKKIITLPEDLTAQIAAGEVIERPASVVKELVENALDAGASNIDVELREGGVALIRVVDDGEGIEAAQAPLVFERHATSKITTLDDLSRLSTLGFRGEAMHSIASVSRVELLTRTNEETAGTRITIEGGRTADIIEAGCPAGTSVKVEDLFFATPARKKFLKKTSTEQSHCVDAVTKLALANPGVGFRVSSGSRTLLDVRGAHSETDRLFLIGGNDFRKQAVVFDQTRGRYRLWGALSTPMLTRSNAKAITSFVNGRPLRDSLVNRAVITSYRRIIEPKRYPVAVLFLEVPGEEVDVNVHPAKLEVRFVNEGAIFAAVTSVIMEELSFIGMHGGTERPERFFSIPERDIGYSHGGGAGEPAVRYHLAGKSKRMITLPGTISQDAFKPRYEADPEAAAVNEPVSLRFTDLDYLGQVAATYLVMGGGERLVLIDQHAAHERIIFERLKSSARLAPPPSQRLLLPDIIDMTPGLFSVLMEFIDLMEEIGFEIVPYGENTVSIRAVPPLLSGLEIRQLIVDTIDEIENTGGRRGSLDEIRENLLAVMACRAAIKANRRLGREEVRALCSDLDTIPNAGTCPHGRPVHIVISSHELERLFKRR